MKYGSIYAPGEEPKAKEEPAAPAEPDKTEPEEEGHAKLGLSPWGNALPENKE